MRSLAPPQAVQDPEVTAVDAVPVQVVQTWPVQPCTETVQPEPVHCTRTPPVTRLDGAVDRSPPVGCGHHHRRTGSRLYGTNGRPGVDVRGGVVTVATRTVADKREWDMVGSFRSFRDGEKPGQRCCRVGEGAACARGARGGRAVRPCPAVLMVLCTTVPPDRSGPRPDHSSAFGSGVGRHAPRPDVPRRGRSALPVEIPKLVIMVRRVERCLPPLIGWFPQPG